MFFIFPQLFDLIPIPIGVELFKERREMDKVTRCTYKTKTPIPIGIGDFKERRRHTLPHNCSTICAGGLNFSVRDGKR